MPFADLRINSVYSRLPTFYGSYSGLFIFDFCRVHLIINQAKYNELPKHYQAIAQSAAMAANVDMLAKYDARNPAALRRLVGAGAQLRPFPQDVLEAFYKATNEVYDEVSAKNADFKKIWESIRAFRNEEYLWFQVAEYSFDNFMIRARARN